jgi:hypothetical protein
VVPDKSERVHSFHHNTVHALAEILAAAGLTHPDQLGPHHLVRRVSQAEIRLFSQLHTFLEPGQLLAPRMANDFYDASWKMANAESFDPVGASWG